MAANMYGLPPAALKGIYLAEGGTAGQEVLNTNGSHDLGPMQINTLWVPELAKIWGMSEHETRAAIRDNICTNTQVAAWILKNHVLDTGSLSTGIARYHSRTTHLGQGYKERVINRMIESGLVE